MPGKLAFVSAFPIDTVEPVESRPEGGRKPSSRRASENIHLHPARITFVVPYPNRTMCKPGLQCAPMPGSIVCTTECHNRPRAANSNQVLPYPADFAVLCGPVLPTVEWPA